MTIRDPTGSEVILAIYTGLDDPRVTIGSAYWKAVFVERDGRHLQDMASADCLL